MDIRQRLFVSSNVHKSDVRISGNCCFGFCFCFVFSFETKIKTPSIAQSPPPFFPVCPRPHFPPFWQLAAADLRSSPCWHSHVSRLPTHGEFTYCTCHGFGFHCWQCAVLTGADCSLVLPSAGIQVDKYCPHHGLHFLSFSAFCLFPPLSFRCFFFLFFF